MRGNRRLVHRSLLGAVVILLLLAAAPLAVSKPTPPGLVLTAPYGGVAHRYLQNMSGHTNCGPGTWASAPVPGRFSVPTGLGTGEIAASLVGCNTSSYAGSYLWVGLQQVRFSVAKSGTYNITIRWAVSFSTLLSIVQNGSGAGAYAGSILGVSAHWHDLNRTGHGKGIQYRERAFPYSLTSAGNVNQSVSNAAILDTFPSARLIGGDANQMTADSELWVTCYDGASHDHISASVDLASPGNGISLESITITPS